MLNAMGTKMPIQISTPEVSKDRKFFQVIDRRKTKANTGATAATSNAAGTLVRIPSDIHIPAKNMRNGSTVNEVLFFSNAENKELRTNNAIPARTNPIVNNSPFAICPSNQGRVVSKENMLTANTVFLVDENSREQMV